MQKTKRGGGGGGIIQGFRLHLARLLLLLLLCSRCLCREQTTEAHQVALVNRNRSAQCLQRVSLFSFLITVDLYIFQKWITFWPRVLWAYTQQQQHHEIIGCYWIIILLHYD